MTAPGEPEQIAGAYLKELTVDGAKRLVQKIQEHRAVFVTDKEGFQASREVRKSAEFLTYKRYISDRELRLEIIAGLLLRKFEERADGQAHVHEIRQRLHDRFKPTGVRRAEFVQRGMLQRVISALEATGAPTERIAAQAQALLLRVEKHTRFVKEEDRIEQLSKEIVVRVIEEAPDTFIVFAKGRARDIAKGAVHLAMKELPPTYVQHPEESGLDFVCMIGESDNGKLRIEWWGP